MQTIMSNNDNYSNHIAYDNVNHLYFSSYMHENDASIYYSKISQIQVSFMTNPSQESRLYTSKLTKTKTNIMLFINKKYKVTSDNTLL